MKNFFNNSILITGSTRSGTTYVGQVLAENNDLIYLWEPFQVGLKERNPAGVFDYWFEYLEEDSPKEKIVLDYLQRYANLNKQDLLRLRTRNLGRLSFELKNIIKKIQFNFRGKYRFILKDPIAFYSAEWLYQQFENLKVIVMIRNPVSIIESYKRLNWDIGFIEMKRQEKLLRQLPIECVSLINEYSNSRVDIVDKGILFWKIIYKKAFDYQEKYRNQWLFIKLEDLEENEETIMKTIFDYCQLEYSKIRKASDQKWLKNASISNVRRKKILSRKEIDKIKESTYDIAQNFGYFD